MEWRPLELIYGTTLVYCFVFFHLNFIAPCAVVLYYYYFCLVIFFFCLIVCNINNVLTGGQFIVPWVLSGSLPLLFFCYAYSSLLCYWWKMMMMIMITMRVWLCLGVIYLEVSYSLERVYSADTQSTVKRHLVQCLCNRVYYVYVDSCCWLNNEHEGIWPVNCQSSHPLM